MASLLRTHSALRANLIQDSHRETELTGSVRGQQQHLTQGPSMLAPATGATLSCAVGAPVPSPPLSTKADGATAFILDTSMITVGTVLVDGERARWVQHRRHSIYGSALDIRLPGAESGAPPYAKGQLLQVHVFPAGCHAPLRVGECSCDLRSLLWQRPGAWVNVRCGFCYFCGTFSISRQVFVVCLVPFASVDCAIHGHRERRWELPFPKVMCACFVYMYVFVCSFLSSA